jgi:hypothetical protein
MMREKIARRDINYFFTAGGKLKAVLVYWGEKP